MTLRRTMVRLMRPPSPRHDPATRRHRPAPICWSNRVKPPTTPRGSKAKPASAPGTTTTPGPEANGAPADANTAPADAGQVMLNAASLAAAAARAGIGAPAPGADSQAPADQAAVATAPEAPAGAGAAQGAADGANDAEASGPGDGTISGAEAAELTIRDFARTEDGEIARDSRGRAIVEERQLRETDILAVRVDGDIVHFVLADGRKISVRK
jgi:hypothetical protein